MKRLRLNAQEWASHRRELERLNSIRPRKCMLRHYLPFHCRGYGNCYKDWEEMVNSTKSMLKRQYWLCFGLAMVLEDNDLSAIWEGPIKYLDK